MNKNIGCIILLSALAITDPVLAISKQSQNALGAFRRYEPEFSSALRNMQELERKMSQTKDESKISDIWLKAEEIMGRAQDRYDSMEDLYASTLAKNPGDMAELNDGFNRLDEMYRTVRDFYADKYTYRSEETENDSEVEIASVPEKPTTTLGKIEGGSYVTPLVADDKDQVITAKEDRKRKNAGKLDLDGSFKFDYKNRDEIHQAVGKGGKGPNDLSQGRLLLTYHMDEDSEWSLDERYLTRERNEKIKENHVALSYFSKHGDNSGLTFRDKLQHIWYPDDTRKNYRINLFETVYTKGWDGRERTANIGFKTKTYPNYSQSDYKQYLIGEQETWFKKYGTAFLEFKGESTKYKNAGNLDYDNMNVYGEYNRTYSGNKAELSLSNTYDRRLYKDESVVAFRTSYYDNYFTLGYELPMNRRVTYRFNGEHTKRNYASDHSRGYSEINVFNGFSMKVNKRTFVSADYRFIYNDENTRTAAHKNNIMHVGWIKNFNKNYKVKLDDTYQNRYSIINNRLDFGQNKFTAVFDWRIKDKYSLKWNTEYFNRRYDYIALGTADYRYLLSGFEVSASKHKVYDWRVSQSWRKLEFRNWGGVSTGWDGGVQPVTELKANYWLKDDIKLGVRATWEKTYYREFNSESQELEYNFGDPMYNKEVYLSLEYIFG